MAAELVNLATSDKLKEMDWIKNIEICELVAGDQGEARDVMKAIKRRLGDKSSNTLLFTVMLLEVLINNCGEHIHRQVIEMGLLPTLVKLVKKKSDQPVREKIFLLLDATQASLGGASGKFPQYYAAYFELVSAGVQFPQTPHVLPSDLLSAMVHKSGSQVSPERKPISPKHEGVAHKSGSQVSPESSIIKKARAALDVLREVLDAIDTQHPEGAKDEFTLDLVEQCSFQKQRVMHLVLTCRDEKVVSQAIELNEQLEKVLARHDELISVRPASSSIHFDHEEAEEEDAHQLSRRIRKGKACVRPEDEEHMEKPLGLFGSIQQERLHRPIIRPMSSEPQEPNTELPAPAVVIPPPLHRPIILPVSSEPQEPNTEIPPPAVVIPPPPARRVERERFFQEKQVDVLADQTTTSSSPSHKTGSSPNRITKH